MTNINETAAGDTPSQLAILDPACAVVDLDPTQWARWYDFLMQPNRSIDSLYILHDQGKVITVNPIRARESMGIPARIEDPAALAADLYQRWKRGPVAIIERNRLNASMDKGQRIFTAEDDFLSYIIKIKEVLLAEATSGVVIHPHPWAGFEGITYDFPFKLRKALVPDQGAATILLAVYSGTELWSSVLFGFKDGMLTLLTTLPASGEAVTDWQQDTLRLIAAAENRHAKVVAGLFCQRDTLLKLGLRPENASGWFEASQQGDLVGFPSTAALLASTAPLFSQK